MAAHRESFQGQIIVGASKGCCGRVVFALQTFGVKLFSYYWTSKKLGAVKEILRLIECHVGWEPFTAKLIILKSKQQSTAAITFVGKCKCKCKWKCKFRNPLANFSDVRILLFIFNTDSSISIASSPSTFSQSKDFTGILET